MARPRLEGLQYFPLDCKFDEKLKNMILLHGNDGLAFVIQAWQEAYQNDAGIYDLSDLRGVIGPITVRVSPDKFAIMLRDSLKLGLFYEVDPPGSQKYTSNGIQKRIEAAHKSRDYDRKYAQKRVIGPITILKTSDNSPISTQMEMEMQKERKENIYSPTFPETAQEYRLARKLWTEIQKTG